MVLMASIPSVSRASFKVFCNALTSVQPAIPDLPLAFQDLFEVIERIEGIRKFA